MRSNIRAAFGGGRWLNRFRSKWPAWPILLVAWVTAWVAISRHWPLTLAFIVSRPALESLADQALANPTGATASLPTQAGLYRIKWVEVRGSEVILYTVPGKSSGFVRAPGRHKDSEWLDEPGVYPSLLEILRLKDDWFALFWPGPS